MRSRAAAIAAVASGISLLAAAQGCLQRVRVGQEHDEAVGGEGAHTGDGGSGGEGGAFIPLAPMTSEIAATLINSCARTSLGGVACWGNNGSGELGIGDEQVLQSVTPVTPLGLGSGVDAIFGGGTGNCARLMTGRLSCWGGVFFGEFGGMPVQGIALSPIELPEVGDNVVEAVIGLMNNCVLTSEGTAKCWGFNTAGQLGIGTTEDSYVPRDVLAPPGVRFRDIGASTGGTHTCAVTTSGEVMCWGSNSSGQLGAPGADQLSPASAGVFDAVTVALGSAHTCALSSSGTVSCWGENAELQLGSSAPFEVVAGLPTAVAIAAGGSATCAVTDAGAVWCWGALGFRPAVAPSEMADSSFAATGVAVGAGHACATNAARVVRCWGSNDSGQLGSGEMEL